MSSSPHATQPHAPGARAPRSDAEPRFTAWPLLATLTGVVGLVALLSENRPDGSDDFDYPLTAQDAASVGHEAFRVSGVAGYVTALLLLLLAATWHHRVGRRFTGSIGATVITHSLVATAALATLAFGWRGALGNYLPSGSEGDTYDAEGLYTYFVLNDFSPYIAFVPLLATGFALGWMAFREGLVAKPLGALGALLAAALLLATAGTGVPGLPALMLVALVVGGVWLAIGRSAITQATGPA